VTHANRLILAHLWLAFGTFAAAAVLGAWQMWVRSPLPAPLAKPELYFISVTAHGTVMAYVVTTLFAMGFGYFVAETALEQPLRGRSAAWVGFWMVVFGLIVAAVPIFLGRASVLYTFYPPLTASPFYYAGVLLIVTGSWIWAGLMIWAMALWKRQRPGQAVPLAMFATVANAILWLWTTVGVGAELIFQLLPAALGWKSAMDVGLARTLFSWTLHSIVYFWLIPAYIGLYTLLPRVAGGRLYSDTMARVAFILFLIFSLPVGMHHLLMDPEHATGFKFLQVALTAMVVLPTLLTVFTVSASLEIAGRVSGGVGVFGWIPALPWHRPMMLGSGMALVALGLGGFGGLINMGYGMNAMVHNTSFVTAHFHLILGGATLIMYFVISYEIWPKLTGRAPSALGLLRGQLWLWFVGILVVTLPGHVLGIWGQPRRVATFDYSNPVVAAWAPWVTVSVVGAVLMLAAALLLLVNLMLMHGGRAVPDRQMHYAMPVNPRTRVPAALNGFALWNVIVAVIMLLSYGLPIGQFFWLNAPQPVIHQVSP
jgi:cytochrome c oxidase subunit 1